MSLVRDGLAIVGVVFLARAAYRGYRDHIQQPLEDYLTEVFDREFQETRKREQQERGINNSGRPGTDSSHTAGSPGASGAS